MGRGKKKILNETTVLTMKEVDILRWVQEGKTNEEIGSILGKSKWTVKFYLKNIMQKLGATSRVQAVSQAIGEGLLVSPAPSRVINDEPTVKVGIVGCGVGGTAIFDIFHDNPAVDILWVADNNPDAVGVHLAKKHNIPVLDDFRAVAAKGIDVILDVTGSDDVRDELERIKPPGADLIGGVSAKLLWQLVEERRVRYEERQRMLKEHESLYHLGLVIENIHSIKDVGYAIIDYATDLTSAPAGSLAIFDERKEDMALVASKGFSKEFNRQGRWDIRKGGLTSVVLNQTAPILIKDLREFSDPNPMLLKEGVRTLLAAPLTVEGRIVGVIYVNDFKVRSFRAEDISLFSLLTLYAAVTLERVKAIEEMRLLSITDGLTGLFNQRHLMEQIQKEVQRADRHKHPLSVIMLDIDHFKDYNDSFGHLSGNKVLKALSRHFLKESRITDTVSRFGGEEFCIVAPELRKVDAVAFAKRLVKGVAGLKVDKRGVTVTVSGGVASYPEDGNASLDLIDRADAYMYKAKRKGRNRICS